MQITLVVSSLLLAAAVNAFPQSLESKAAIISQEQVLNLDGTFKNTFETENKIRQEQIGYLKQGPASKDGPGVVQVIQGGYSYVAPDGTVISTGYTSDENGFQPAGSHLPTPPPIPEKIQESLRLLASLPSTPEPQYQ
ncbi:endocuticle structural glycoprotein SgAbd-4-like [Adelges cooleyi]|uniref:endocuticle structural glycoprotein SgAbd-4-like n=1 Tax=Adelges cooleyi TaxID=133065 RepID=UPI0021804E84|nr:endocuticle structural glycoprotein SgAbd-4-like [Adelges cooleyi]